MIQQALRHIDSSEKPRGSQTSARRTVSVRVHSVLFLLRTIVILFLCCSSSWAEEPKSAAQAEKIGSRIRQKWPKERPIDTQALRSAGVHALEGKHLLLYTDLEPGPRINQLPALFDALIPFLCDYFGLKIDHYDAFRVEGFLIEDAAKFESSGALKQVPELGNGYALRNRIWLRVQSSDYYLRHLLLHEGVHAFMGYAFGVWGPPWYREGTAELIGTHHWDGTKLELAYTPDRPEEVARWGRIEYVRRDCQNKKFKSVQDIFHLGPEDYDANEAYAWSWAFAAFCENHPNYRASFRKTAWNLAVPPEKVAEHLIDLMMKESEKSVRKVMETQIQADWSDFLANIDYAYDFERTVIHYPDHVASLPTKGTGKLKIQADKGWQCSGFQVKKGTTYSFQAEGRVQLDNKPKIWWSEPDGVTIQYHRGIPLGKLIATILPDDVQDNEINDLAKNQKEGIGFYDPKSIGSKQTWTVPETGTLYFRINDRASSLDNNQGELTVTVRPQRKAP